MARRISLIAVVVMLAAVLLPVSVASADYGPEDCQDGLWEVRPGQSLYSIAYICGTTVQTLVQLNGIVDPNIINTGQILILPGAGDVPIPDPVVAQAPVTIASTPVTVGNGQVVATFGELSYGLLARDAKVDITVTNVSYPAEVNGGRWHAGYYAEHPSAQWVTLLGANHVDPVRPFVSTEPLWKATVYLDDGTVFPAYAGCIFAPQIWTEGDEPTSRADNIWFHWEWTIDGAWFDCGNGYQVKPDNLDAGESGTAPLTIYLGHPSWWSEFERGTRAITRIDVEVFDRDMNSLGIVGSATFDPSLHPDK